MTMSFYNSADTSAGLFSSVMAHSGEIQGAAGSTCPDSIGIFPTVEGSCGFQLILAAPVSAICCSLSAVGLSFRAAGLGLQAAVSWLAVTPASTYNVIVSGSRNAITATTSTVSHTATECSTAALDRLARLITTGPGYLMSMATAAIQATCSCLISYPADVIKAAVQHLLSFPAVVRQLLYLSVVQPVALVRAGASCLASNTLLALKAVVFNLLVYPVVAVRGGLSYMGASAAMALRIGVIQAYGWATPLMWSCLLPLAALLVFLVFWPEMQVGFGDSWCASTSLLGLLQHEIQSLHSGNTVTLLLTYSWPTTNTVLHGYEYNVGNTCGSHVCEATSGALSLLTPQAS